MVGRVAGGPRIIGRLGQDEGALQHGLRVQGEALGSPVARHSVARTGSLNVINQCERMAPDRILAGLAQRRQRVIGFLHHGSDKAGELANRPVQHVAPELQITENPVQRIFRRHERRAAEQFIRMQLPRFSGRNAKVHLGWKMMEERALGHACLPAEIVHGGRIESLLAHYFHGGADQLVFRGGLPWGHQFLSPYLKHTNWLV